MNKNNIPSAWKSTVDGVVYRQDDGEWKASYSADKLYAEWELHFVYNEMAFLNENLKGESPSQWCSTVEGVVFREDDGEWKASLPKRGLSEMDTDIVHHEAAFLNRNNT